MRDFNFRGKRLKGNKDFSAHNSIRLAYCVVLKTARPRADVILPASPEFARVTQLMVLSYEIIVVFRKNAAVFVLRVYSDRFSCGSVAGEYRLPLSRYSFSLALLKHTRRE